MIVSSSSTSAGVAHAPSGGMPALTDRYNAGGGGDQASLVIELTSNPHIHVTIYESTWDGMSVPGDGEAALGPHCPHSTHSGLHRFYTVECIGADPAPIQRSTGSHA